MRLRNGWRSSILAAALIATGVGAAVSVYSVRRAIAPDAVPYPDASRLVALRVGGPSWSPAMLEAVRTDGAALFDRVIGIQERAATVTSPGAVATSVRLESVSAAYFETAGVRATLGRVFSPAEDVRDGQSAIVVVSESFWRSRFGGDPGIIGRALTVDGRSVQIIGVLPGAFRGLIGRTDLWTPLGSARWLQGDVSPERPTSRWFEVIGRVSSGVPIEQVPARFEALARSALADLGPGLIDERTRISAVPLGLARVPAMIPAAVQALTIAVVALVLLTTANALSLHGTRLDDEARALAIRVAIGAERRHLWGDALATAATVAVAGMAGGLLLRPMLLEALAAIQPTSSTAFGLVTAELLTAQVMATDRAVVLMAALVAGVTTLPLWLWSVWRIRACTRAPRLVNDRGVTRGRATTATVLLAVQATVACAAIGGGTLLLLGRTRITGTDRGYQSDAVLTGAIALRERYDSVAGRQFFDRVLDRLRAEPGVTGASVANCVPGAGRCRRTSVDHVDGRPLDRSRQPQVGLHYATPDHLAVIGASLAAGRFFTDGDVSEAPAVAVVSERLAAALWPDGSPIGHTLEVFSANGALRGPRTVVGVTRTIAFDAERDAGLDVFLPASQAGWTSGVVFARGATPESLARAVAALDPDVPVMRVAPLADTLGRALAIESFLERTIFAFGIAGLVLAALGMYAAVARRVAARRREIGVRVALGATPRRIRGLAMQHALRLSILATACGALGAYVAGGLLKGFLHGTPPWHPVALLAGPVLTLTVITLAASLPAFRAARANPVDALRVSD